MTDDQITRLGNLIANLAHPKGDCCANDFEDEAHDILRDLRATITALTQEKELLKATLENIALYPLPVYGEGDEAMVKVAHAKALREMAKEALSAQRQEESDGPRSASARR